MCFCFYLFLGISALKNLKVLSIGRNHIKSFSGLEPLGDTLKELWISYNLIEKMKGINVMRNLQVLYMSNNLIKEWNEFGRLQELANLRDLLFVGNPICDGFEVTFMYSDSRVGGIWCLWNGISSVHGLIIYCIILKVEQWRSEVARRLPNLEKLDGEPIIRTEENIAGNQTVRSDTVS